MAAASASVAELQHGDVRARRLLLVHHAAYPDKSSLGAGLGLPTSSLGTTICSASAIAEQCGTVLMFQLRGSGTSSSSDLVSGGGEQMEGIDTGQVFGRHGANHTVSLDCRFMAFFSSVSAAFSC